MAIIFLFEQFEIDMAFDVDQDVVRLCHVG